MSAPLSVTVVRPKRTGREVGIEFAASIIGIFTRGLFILWLAPIAFDWHPGYLQAVSAGVLVTYVGRRDSSEYRQWTREARR